MNWQKQMADNHNNCDHCWHAKSGPYMMVLRDGCILQQCCKCDATKQVHKDHAWEGA